MQMQRWAESAAGAAEISTNTIEKSRKRHDDISSIPAPAGFEETRDIRNPPKWASVKGSRS